MEDLSLKMIREVVKESKNEAAMTEYIILSLFLKNKNIKIKEV